MDDQRSQDGSVDPDQICEWLSTGPSLDEVAAEVRRLGLSIRHSQAALEVLRLHVLAAFGEANLLPPSLESPF